MKKGNVRLRKGVKNFSTRGLFYNGHFGRNIDEFIKIAKMIYGNRYTYERVVYRYSRTPVEITCKKHGVFKRAPDRFFKGEDCPQCRKEEFCPSFDRERFIEKVKNIYGDKYDYSLVRYTSLDDPIIVICPEHGRFKITPRKHLHESHCPKCHTFKPWDNKRFLKEAKKVHGNKYDYSEIEKITTVLQKITIICPKHGKFKQKIMNHISLQQGCPACGNLNKGNFRKISFYDFVKAARKIHGNKYQYYEDTYTALSHKTVIKCPIHGKFSQTAEKHARTGRGCPKCGIANRAITRKKNLSKKTKNP